MIFSLLFLLAPFLLLLLGEVKADALPLNDESENHRREQEEDSGEPFTIVFVSDLENAYREHDARRSSYVISYIRDLAEANLFYDDEFERIPIEKPALVIHGGDISHMWGCEYSLCRPLVTEYLGIWQQLFAAGIPMISSYGNHDFWVAEGTGNQAQWPSSGPLRPHTSETDRIARQSNRFVATSFTQSARLGVEYQEFQPTGVLGQSMYRATVRGVQIAHFNCAANWESYDASGIYPSDPQFNALAESLDRNLTTLFVEHYPVTSLRSKQEETKNLIWQFERAAHLSGHVHRPLQITHDHPSGNASFVDYVAPYPHTWGSFAPGFYAILVSATDGILQVKQIDIPGLEDGTPCDRTGDCEMCHSGSSRWYDIGEYRCGQEPRFDDGRVCIPYLSCYSCSGFEYSFWFTKSFFACGQEPQLVDGTLCRRFTSCRACENPPTNWGALGGLACGMEP